MFLMNLFEIIVSNGFTLYHQSLKIIYTIFYTNFENFPNDYQT